MHRNPKRKWICYFWIYACITAPVLKWVQVPDRMGRRLLIFTLSSKRDCNPVKWFNLDLRRHSLHHVSVIKNTTNSTDLYFNVLIISAEMMHEETTRGTFSALFNSNSFLQALTPCDPLCSLLVSSKAPLFVTTGLTQMARVTCWGTWRDASSCCSWRKRS